MKDVIQFDVACLRGYFSRLFELLADFKAHEVPPPETLEDLQRITPRDFQAFVKPDMVSNIYSLVDFWLSKLCEMAEPLARGLRAKDIHGKSDLDARYKFLTKVAGLDLSQLSANFLVVDQLRQVRNVHLHKGGHIGDEQEKELAKVPGVTVNLGLVVVEDAFVWNCLDAASSFLLGVSDEVERALAKTTAA